MIAWDVYLVTITIDDRLVGGIPVVPEGADRADAYEAWARGQEVEPGDAAALAAKLADDADMPVALADVEGLETGFRSDDEGLYIEARQVKAMLREAAQRLGLIKRDTSRCALPGLPAPTRRAGPAHSAATSRSGTAHADATFQ